MTWLFLGLDPCQQQQGRERGGGGTGWGEVLMREAPAPATVSP